MNHHILCLIAAATVLLWTAEVTFAKMPSVRPPPSARKMNSSFIDALIVNMSRTMKDPDLATLFANCFPNTLDTTVHSKWSAADAFVVTGDIPAMWLRDSTNQLLPYVPFLHAAPELKDLVHGVVMRQLRSVLLDSYANAFNYGPSGAGHPTDLRDPPMTPGVFEGKFEVDSLCAVIKLAHSYYNATGDSSVLIQADRVFFNAALKIFNTLTNATLGTIGAFETNRDLPFYRFLRDQPWEYDVYPKNTVTPTIGMARSAFRPSDDATLYDFLVPSNAMAWVELRHLSELSSTAASLLGGDAEFEWLAEGSMSLSDQIHQSLSAYAVRPIDNATSAILAYEVDGLGNANLMDDPNIPSLLSLPMLGANVTDVAPGMRGWLLSAANPYYYCGAVGCGIGSPHTPPGYIWPMSIMVRALTSDNATEIQEQLEMLKASAQGTGWMHESFNPNNTSQFTRPWFAWANTLFGQTIIEVGRRFPELIYR